MKTIKRILLLAFVLCCSFVFSSCSLCFAEAEYRITESELTQLETSLTELSQLNTASQSELAMLKKNLVTSENELSAAKAQTMKLESTLAELTQTSAEQESLLLNANRRLDEYAQEEKRRISKVKRQRNLAYGLLAAGVYLYCRK